MNRFLISISGFFCVLIIGVLTFVTLLGVCAFVLKETAMQEDNLRWMAILSLFLSQFIMGCFGGKILKSTAKTVTLSALMMISFAAYSHNYLGSGGWQWRGVSALVIVCLFAAAGCVLMKNMTTGIRKGSKEPDGGGK